MSIAPSILGWMSSLSDPTRVRALRLLERREVSVAELCDVLQMPQSTVSRHLKVLADDGWVVSRREGTSRLYSMSDSSLPAARPLWALLREQFSDQSASRSDDERLERVLAARQSRSQVFFASSAGQWDRLRDELFGAQLDRAVLAGLLEESWVVGDCGCGTGGTAEALSPFVQRVIAIDSSAAMLQAARERTQHLENVEVRRGDLDALPLDDRSLDAALGVLVLHHLADPARALVEMARALKPEGKALILDMQPHDRQDYRAQMGHVWLGISTRQIERWLTDAGFENARVRLLPPTSHAKGPPLFVATALKPVVPYRKKARPT
jgi:ubiquinone/menaquinone biosynthesis C-methylase UbiE/DNA-binding transcriptional ArsR family regulator